MKRQRADNPAVIFRAAELFLNRDPKTQRVEDVVKQLNLELDPEPPLTRETLYPLLGKARQLGFLKLVTPLEGKLARDIETKFELGARRVIVADCPLRESNEHVSATAAIEAMKLAREVRAATGKPVGIGLGPGRATLDFSRYFSEELRSDASVPELTLVAISAGAPPRNPEVSPISYFNLFPPNRIKTKIGLFAETLVPNKDYEDIKKRAGVKQAFEAKDEIDMVVTSMGDPHDEHDLFTTYLAECQPKAIAWLNRKGCVGNVQYRPYSAKGPITEGTEPWLRAVTVFELADLVALSMQKNKHVILIGRRCGACERTRASALRPILENPILCVFSVLVIDSATAHELLHPPQE